MIRNIVEKIWDGSHKYVEAAAKSTDTWPSIGLVTGSLLLESDTGKRYVYDEVTQEWTEIANSGNSTNRLVPGQSIDLATENVIDCVGIPPYISDVSEYSAYGLTEAGWYVFVRILAETGTTVTSGTTVTGAAGYVATVGNSYIDIAVKFDVAAMACRVTVDWGTQTDTYVFRATDLAVRNLDYRTTFYVYDAAPFVTWEYALTTDTKFVADKKYYTTDGTTYTLATVTVDEDIPAETYYNHSKCIISGLVRNVTYKLDEIIDCPMEFILPAIEDETHGCWYEIRLQHAGEYSMTLTPPSDDVKIATEHTQKETAGINMIDLHYTALAGTKIWRFMNTHSSIPA